VPQLAHGFGGWRELRQRASELLRRVEAGETIEITDRGRPVALLSPMPVGGPYEQMLASGEIKRATLDFDDLPEPLELEAGVELPTVTLARLREHER
jgi:antitoxin (DNA-binding transcriptional repressor) of toxin-antitoxin stability system